MNKLEDKKGGYKGEFGTAINSENYVAFALSVYFQETLSVQAPFEPEGPWRNIPRRFVDPVPGHPDPYSELVGKYRLTHRFVPVQQILTSRALIRANARFQCPLNYWGAHEQIITSLLSRPKLQPHLHQAP